MRQFKMRLDSQLIFLEWTNIMNIMLPKQELNFYLKLPSNISGTNELTKQNFVLCILEMGRYLVSREH